MTGEFDDRTSAPVFSVVHNNMYFFSYTYEFTSLASKIYLTIFLSFLSMEWTFFINVVNWPESGRGGFMLSFYTLYLN